MTTVYLGGDKITSRHITGTYLHMITSFTDKIILTVAFASDPNKIAVLVREEFTFMFLYLLDINSGTMERSTFLTEVTPDYFPIGPTNMRFFASARESLLLWNETMVWVSFYDNTLGGFLEIFGMFDLSLVSRSSTIHELIVGESFSYILVSCYYYTVMQYAWKQFVILVLEELVQ